ncbi:unnamed protein product, partial [marine sediment metagenome]
NLLEFTYKDKKGYHTVVGCGDVPADNQEIQKALEKGWITEMKDKETGRQGDMGKKNKKKTQSRTSDKSAGLHSRK